MVAPNTDKMFGPINYEIIAYGQSGGRLYRKTTMLSHVAFGIVHEYAQRREVKRIKVNSLKIEQIMDWEIPNEG